MPLIMFVSSFFNTYVNLPKKKTYNRQLKERFGDNPSPHLDFDSDLWMKVRSSGKLDKTRAYRFSNIMTKNLWMACSVSTIGSSQLILSIQSSEFTALLQQGVQEHMVNLNEKYERLSTEYEELL